MIFFVYIGREFLRFVALIISFFTLIYCVIDFLEKNARYFPKYETSGVVILEYYLLQMPKMMIDLLPFAVLFASIITLWSFARSGEIAAARACGASITRIMLPLFILSALLSLISFLFSDLVIPEVQRRLRYVETVKIQDSEFDRTYLESNWIKSVDRVLHYRRYDRVTGHLRYPTMYETSPDRRLLRIVQSPMAFFDEDSQTWVFRDAVESRFPQRGGRKIVTQIHRELDSDISAEPPRLLSSGIQPSELGFRELHGLIRESEEAGISAEKRLFDLYQKVSMPMASFLFVFLSLPFAVMRERQVESYAGVILALGAALLFWVGSFSMRGFAQAEAIPPLLGAFVMNIILLVYGIWQVKKINAAV